MKKSTKKLRKLLLTLSMGLVFAQAVTPTVSYASIGEGIIKNTTVEGTTTAGDTNTGESTGGNKVGSYSTVSAEGNNVVYLKNTTKISDSTPEDANSAMKKAVYGTKETGNNIGITCSNKTVTINPTEWGKLSREEQKVALEALAGSKYYNSITSEDRSEIVSALEECSGTKDGTVLMTILFGNTKPDWAGAYKIIEPFNGPIGKILGVVTLVCAFCLVGVMLCDIFYMTIPWVRVKGDGKDVRWVSHAAIKAIEKCETSGNEGGGQVLWEYLKHRAIMLFLFGICILYLICGKIFNIIGWFMDLASGTL